MKNNYDPAQEEVHISNIKRENCCLPLSSRTVPRCIVKDPMAHFIHQNAQGPGRFIAARGTEGKCSVA